VGGVPSLLGTLPPLAPAPGGTSSSSTAAVGTTPAKRSSRSGSAAPSTSTSATAKGKGKAKLPAAPAAKDGKVVGKVGGGKKAQQMGPDGKPVPKKKKAGRACAACQKAHLTCDDGAFFLAPFFLSSFLSYADRGLIGSGAILHSSTVRSMCQERMSRGVRGWCEEEGEVPLGNSRRACVLYSPSFPFSYEVDPLSPFTVLRGHAGPAPGTPQTATNDSLLFGGSSLFPPFPHPFLFRTS
jgi:hypothetical protein